MENKMMMFNDDYGHCAVVREVKILAHREAKKRTSSWEFTLYSTFDNNRVYHLSMHESLEDALKNLELFSCGTFK